jgi:hypothetical protein
MLWIANMLHLLVIPLLTISLFVGMILMMNLGKKLGTLLLMKRPDKERSPYGSLEAAVFGLLGLLIAFSFSGAAARLDSRKKMVIDEANCIGTAYLRLDFLPAETQAVLKEKYRQHVQLRLDTFRYFPDVDLVKTTYRKNQELLTDIWNQSVAACKTLKDPAVTSAVVNATNAMIDITTSRTRQSLMHQPVIIFALLFALALGCSLLAGYGMAINRSRNKIHQFWFALLMSIVIYVILDIEYPRTGIIREDYFDKVLVDQLDSMK